jgi:hypothetical protein
MRHDVFIYRGRKDRVLIVGQHRNSWQAFCGLGRCGLKTGRTRPRKPHATGNRLLFPLKCHFPHLASPLRRYDGGNWFYLLSSLLPSPSTDFPVFQQAVYVAMVKIAKDFKDHDTQQRYLNACERFRFPYWDPCLPRQTINQAEFGVPKIVSSPSVYVKKSDNPEVLTPVNNPLYAFKFPTAVQPLDNSDFSWGQDANVSSPSRPLI